MCFLEVGPLSPGFFYHKIRIKIPVAFLCTPYEGNYVVTPFFQSRIGFLRQRISGRFQPFCNIAVLKDHAVKFTAAFSRFVHLSCLHEVFNSVAFLYPRDCIIKYFFLIRYDRVDDKFFISPEKGIRYREHFQRVCHNLLLY